MARQALQGMTYFPVDVHFLSDIKIRKIARKCGPEAVAVLIAVLGCIYRDEGYYLQWDDDMEELIADESNVPVETVQKTVAKALDVGFLDNDKYQRFKVLTSRGIQKRYIAVVKNARRKGIQVRKDFLIDDTVLKAIGKYPGIEILKE